MTLPSLLLPLCLSVFAQDAPAQETAPVPPPGPTWRSIEECTIEGRAWEELAAPYDRLPAKCEGLVRGPVWNLQQDSAGICARFTTNAKEIQGRWTLTSDDLAMPHMPASGVSGLDLYGRDETGSWRWVGATKPTAVQNTAKLATGLDGKEREYMLYLPLYNGVKSVELGLPAGASFSQGAPRLQGREKPVVYYGTSITHGGSASRPGMGHPAMLGRWLDRPFVNLGFSGNGRMDLELAPIIGEIDAAAFVIDCLPNMNAGTLSQRAVPFVRALRSARPDTPIVLVEDRSYTGSSFRKGQRDRQSKSRAALRKAFATLTEEGIQGLTYLEGSNLLGHDGEGAVDGSHPTDLGFMRQAKAFEPVLRGVLDQPKPLRVLILGDSISIGYTPHVRQALKGQAIVVRASRGGDDRRTENCAGTTKGVRQIDRWLAQDGGSWDVIHFNFGLHDLKRVHPETRANSNDPAHPRQAEPAQYEANLRKIVERLQATGATLIFATTTPVPEGVKPMRDVADGPRYNAIATGIMAEAGIAVNDLFAHVEENGARYQRPADVHFKPAGSKRLAAKVAAAILAVSEAGR